jgi:hypothetical protein
LILLKTNIISSENSFFDYSLFSGSEEVFNWAWTQIHDKSGNIQKHAKRAAAAWIYSSPLQANKLIWIFVFKQPEEDM